MMRITEASLKFLSKIVIPLFSKSAAEIHKDKQIIWG